MNARALAAAPLAALLALAGCNETCPTDTAYVEAGSTPACSSPAPRQVSIQLRLCEDCSRTSPKCDVDLTYLAQNQIHLDTIAEICEENRSCDFQAACDIVTCSFEVPAGLYEVYPNVPSGTQFFTLDTRTGASCTGTIASIE